MVRRYRYECPKDMAKNFGIASAVPEGYKMHNPFNLARRYLLSSFLRQGMCLRILSFFRQGNAFSLVPFSGKECAFEVYMSIKMLRWLSEWDDTLLLAGSPAAMQVQRKGRRDTVRYLGEPPPTVLPLLWG